MHWKMLRAGAPSLGPSTQRSEHDQQMWASPQQPRCRYSWCVCVCLRGQGLKMPEWLHEEGLRMIPNDPEQVPTTLPQHAPITCTQQTGAQWPSCDLPDYHVLQIRSPFLAAKYLHYVCLACNFCDGGHPAASPEGGGHKSCMLHGARTPLWQHRALVCQELSKPRGFPPKLAARRGSPPTNCLATKTCVFRQCSMLRAYVSPMPSGARAAGPAH